ncbi:blood group Rh(CE) polypeptide [Octodon degus]|uniref:Blood group Rh(D) polypeptide n=1 Tax=Octodon degus TaxID=10160 RepID=A0A6P6F1C9_OCTDE|nr:blood group Rh(CE) polypeptide [Octodon degus]
MGSNYPRNVRCCLPWWVLAVEAVLVVLFFFFTSYDPSPKDQKMLLGAYQALQDLTIIAALGFGFLTSYLRRHSWSSVAFNLFMLALGVQWAVLLDGFLSQLLPGKVVINLFSVRLATMSAMSVLISAGAVLGRANLAQLSVMVLVEVTAFGTMKLTHKELFNMDDHRSMMHIHVFAAYFGLAVARCLSGSLPKEKKVQAENIEPVTHPSLFSMLGTLFLWMFWPSFNSALLDIANEKKNAVFNTYYALAVSTVTATSVSALNHREGKINMIDIHNAVLAGGVAVGASCHLISTPWIAMVLGLLAGLISIGGARCLSMCLNSVLGIQDHSGVHYTFAFPGLLGGFAYIVLTVLTSSGIAGGMTGYMMLMDIGALSFAMAMGMGSGFLTGLLLKLKIWRAPQMVKHFDDQAFWEFPHLAVGY